MLKLKYLFDNRDLANMLLGFWQHDDSKQEVMEYYRISANAVYPYYNSGTLNFLRFAPLEEKPAKLVRAELAFLAYLQEEGYKAVTPLPSLTGKDIIVSDTPWGKYIAVAFAGMTGESIADCPYSASLYYKVGKSLAQLHHISSDYKVAENTRPNWQDRLACCKDVLLDYKAPNALSTQLDQLQESLIHLPQTQQNYGLIHYDFEPDNLFYNAESQTVCPIDFDDSLYHWFTMDIVKTIDSLQEELTNENSEQAVNSFLDGYKSIMPIDETIFKQADLFRKYADIFTYARIIRSTSEQWDNEPEWMQQLRMKLNEYKAMLESSLSLES